jgi:hypothetical protein
MRDFEEYKLFVEDTGRFSERRQTVTNIYITINGAIAGLITFLVKDSGLSNWWLTIAILPLIGFGVIVCYYWRQLIDKYKVLVGFRLKLLREMETQIPTSIQMYHREDQIYPRAGQGDLATGAGLNFSDREVLLPNLFIFLYVVLGMSIVIGTTLVMSGALPSPI